MNCEDEGEEKAGCWGKVEGATASYKYCSREGRPPCLEHGSIVSMPRRSRVMDMRGAGKCGNED